MNRARGYPAKKLGPGAEWVGHVSHSPACFGEIEILVGVLKILTVSTLVGLNLSSLSKKLTAWHRFWTGFACRPATDRLVPGRVIPVNPTSVIWETGVFETHLQQGTCKHPGIMYRGFEFA
jgi:hypothetical protein